MGEFGEYISNLFGKFMGVLSNFDSVGDVLDVILVTVIIYGLFIQLRKTQSIQIIKGVILVAVIYALVTALEMNTSQYLFNQLFSNIILILVIIFNAEIRLALEHVGQSSFNKITLFNTNVDETSLDDAINSVCRACTNMCFDNVGSLMIFQRNTLLGDLTKAAVPIDAQTTTEMLLSIFYPNSSLHDGAVVIDKGRIVAARCIVPLKNDREVVENVGTRHRAALEVSRMSDAVAVVTSEETGILSIAVDGELIRGIDEDELREKLRDLLMKKEDTSSKKWQRFKRIQKGAASQKNDKASKKNGGGKKNGR